MTELIMKTQPIVSVVMITYKHETFISEAIEGVLMQICDFEVELIIADDCSPDGTEKIVRKYIENHPRGHWIKYHKHEKNVGMMPNFNWALNQAKGKYIAICDGDDYWIDNSKLKYQSEILLNNADIVLTYTNCFIDNSRTKTLLNLNDSIKFSIYEYLDQKYLTASASLFFINPRLAFNKNFIRTPIGDEYLVAVLLKNRGMCLYSPKSTAFYRMHEGGIYSQKKLVAQLFFKLKTLDLLKIEFVKNKKAQEIIVKVITNNIDRLYNYTFDGFHGLSRWSVFHVLIKYQPKILIDYRFYYNWFLKKKFGK
jgi:glycosyltransferase involved in cell wall biosynthesis